MKGMINYPHDHVGSPQRGLQANNISPKSLSKATGTASMMNFEKMSQRNRATLYEEWNS